jgi:hypothetical protein
MKSSGTNQIKEILNSIYDDNIEAVYDEVNQKISNKYHGDGLEKTNFYYYNLMKNREELTRDFQIQKQ